jgi:hypothetical protein
MRPGARLLVIRAVRVTRKAARQRRRALERELERELASYSTPAQRQDLEATFDRYPDAATQELRDILARQSMSGYPRAWPAAGSAGPR